MSRFPQDLRLGIRSLRKAPVFTAAVVLTLGLGIGANAAVFAVVNRLLLKPLPVRDPGNLYVIAVQHEGNEDPHNVSWLDYLDYRDRSGAFADLAAYDFGFVGFGADNHAERITISFVPDGVSRTKVEAHLFVPRGAAGSTAERSRSHWERNAALFRQTVREDLALSESIQRGISSGREGAFVFGTFEHGLAHFRAALLRLAPTPLEKEGE